MRSSKSSQSSAHSRPASSVTSSASPIGVLSRSSARHSGLAGRRVSSPDNDIVPSLAQCVDHSESSLEIRKHAFIDGTCKPIPGFASIEWPKDRYLVNFIRIAAGPVTASFAIEAVDDIIVLLLQLLTLEEFLASVLYGARRHVIFVDEPML